MSEIQKWLKEHDCELSMIANAYGLNQIETVIAKVEFSERSEASER